jgi:hypothetical protein
MIETQERPALTRLAALARDFQARILNCSSSGCLIETNVPLEVGTVGSLRFVIDGRELVDDVQVVRCQAVEGAGSLYQVGARFLWATMASGRGALRLALAERVDV